LCSKKHHKQLNQKADIINLISAFGLRKELRNIQFPPLTYNQYITEKNTQDQNTSYSE